jgi:hypothetical protein
MGRKSLIVPGLKQLEIPILSVSITWENKWFNHMSLRLKSDRFKRNDRAQEWQAFLTVHKDLLVITLKFLEEQKSLNLLFPIFEISPMTGSLSPMIRSSPFSISPELAPTADDKIKPLFLLRSKV